MENVSMSGRRVLQRCASWATLLGAFTTAWRAYGRLYSFCLPGLALLWQIQFLGRLEANSAVGTSVRWLMLRQHGYDHASNGWQCRLRRAASLPFFPLCLV